MSQIIFNSTDLKHSREYYESKRPRFLGFSVVFLSVILVLGIISIFVFQIEDVVKGRITIRPSSNISKVISKVGGYATEKYYKNGDKVNKGDVLLKIDSTIAQNKLEETKMFVEKNTKKISDLELYVDAIINEKENPFNRIDDLVFYPKFNSYINERDRRLASIEQRRFEKKIEANKPSGYRLKTNIDRIDLEINVSQLDLDSWTSNLLLDANNEIDMLKKELVSLKTNIAIYEREISDSTITAPITGNIIEERQFNINDVIFNNEELLKIIPEEQDFLKVRIEIRADQVAELKTGMKIKISFDSLPPSDYGFVFGEVTTIPKDAYFNDKNALFYLLEGEIVNHAIHKKNKTKVILRPGMTGNGRVIKKKKPIAEFIGGILDWY